MTWRTHALAGISSLWLLRALPHGPGIALPGGTGLLAALAAVGALLPDMDAVESKIKHLSFGGVAPFAVPSQVLHAAFGHRGLLHSALGLLLFGLLVTVPLAFWWGGPAALALWLGYASHLALDACTKTGIPFRHPLSGRCFLLPRPFRVVTGSPMEDVVLALLVLPAMLLILSSVG